MHWLVCPSDGEMNTAAEVARPQHGSGSCTPHWSSAKPTRPPWQAHEAASASFLAQLWAPLAASWGHQSLFKVRMGLQSVALLKPGVMDASSFARCGDQWAGRTSRSGQLVLMCAAADALRACCTGAGGRLTTLRLGFVGSARVTVASGGSVPCAGGVSCADAPGSVVHVALPAVKHHGTG